MVEVFKTNVDSQQDARMLIRRIQQDYNFYQASFDLEDCDRVLRVVHCNGIVMACQVIDLLSQFGFKIEILSDEPVSDTNIFNTQKDFILY